jgi:hypothetical protein
MILCFPGLRSLNADQETGKENKPETFSRNNKQGSFCFSRYQINAGDKEFYTDTFFNRISSELYV